MSIDENFFGFFGSILLLKFRAHPIDRTPLEVFGVEDFGESRSVILRMAIPPAGGT